MERKVSIIGGGLAGCEAAYQIAKRGIKVDLYEMKPENFSPAHSNKDLAEIVCSNSFKSNLHTNACGLLKEELRLLDSLLIKIADTTAVPAGQALAVDREEFSKKVTQEIEKNPNITIIREEVGEGKKVSLKTLIKNGVVIIATGPLSSDSLSKEILFKEIAEFIKENEVELQYIINDINKIEKFDENIDDLDKILCNIERVLIDVDLFNKKDILNILSNIKKEINILRLDSFVAKKEKKLIKKPIR